MSDDIPEYSAEAYLGYSVLFDVKKIIVFIEDTKGVNIYESIFQRLFLSENFNGCIQPVGSKRKLIEVYKEYSKISVSEQGVPSFFIADLDFDLIIEKTMISDINFIYLERYSIENYLIDETVGSKFINGRTSQGFENCKKLLNFDEWINKFSMQYVNVLSILATMEWIQLGEKSCSHSPFLFTLEDSWEIDNEKVDYFLHKNVYNKCTGSKKLDFDRTIIRTEENIEKYFSNRKWDVIPGKQLLKVYTLYLSSFCSGGSPKINDFINFAAETCNVDTFVFIKEKINNYMRMNSNLGSSNTG